MKSHLFLFIAITYAGRVLTRAIDTRSSNNSPDHLITTNLVKREPGQCYSNCAGRSASPQKKEIQMAKSKKTIAAPGSAAGDAQHQLVGQSPARQTDSFTQQLGLSRARDFDSVSYPSRTSSASRSPVSSIDRGHIRDPRSSDRTPSPQSRRVSLDSSISHSTWLPSPVSSFRSSSVSESSLRAGRRTGGSPKSVDSTQVPPARITAKIRGPSEVHVYRGQRSIMLNPKEAKVYDIRDGDTFRRTWKDPSRVEAHVLNQSGGKFYMNARGRNAQASIETNVGNRGKLQGFDDINGFRFYTARDGETASVKASSQDRGRGAYATMSMSGGLIGGIGADNDSVQDRNAAYSDGGSPVKTIFTSRTLAAEPVSRPPATSSAAAKMKTP